MKILVLGALNIDRTYTVEKIAVPKETVAAKGFASFCGGKGFNQAVALARAGSEVSFAGVIGSDGDIFLDALRADGVNPSRIRRSPGPNGHAVIQVDRAGQNCIIIVAGSNGEVDKPYIDEVLADFSAGDLLVLQNEVSNVDYAITAAHARGLKVAFNPSPFNEKVLACDLSQVDFLLVNEVEGAALCAPEGSSDIPAALHSRYPNTAVLLTKGEDGSEFISRDGRRSAAAAIKCKAVDTTAAGDTHTGYFLHTFLAHGNPEQALKTASIASGISVTRKGASPSIPFAEEVRAYEKARCRSGSAAPRQAQSHAEFTR